MNILNTLKKIKHGLEPYLFNYWKTLVINFRLLPFRQALHLPVVVYGKIDLCIGGRSRIVLNVPAKFALFKWGYNQDMMVPSSMPSMLMMVDGTMVLNGKVRTSPGCVFRIQGGVVDLQTNVNSGGVLKC